MSDPKEKTIKLPARPEVAMKIIAAPVRPALLPKQSLARMPVRPASAQPVHLSAGPIMLRQGRRTDSAPARPRAAAPMTYASTPPKPRGEMSFGSFGALASAVIPTNREREAAWRARCEQRYDSDRAFRVTSVIHALYEEPIERDAMVPLTARVLTARTSLETQALREQGYRHSRETAKLGDLSGRRAIAHWENGAYAETVIQQDVPVHWFMSPDIPAWKSRAVPTERIGQATTRVVSDRGEELFKAIFDGPTFELVVRLCSKRWQRYCNQHHGTEESAQALYDQLFDETVADEFRKADLRIEYAFSIGEARFARLWNHVVEACRPKPPAAELMAEVSASATDTAVTA